MGRYEKIIKKQKQNKYCHLSDEQMIETKIAKGLITTTSQLQVDQLEKWKGKRCKGGPLISYISILLKNIARIANAVQVTI